MSGLLDTVSLTCLLIQAIMDFCVMQFCLPYFLEPDVSSEESISTVEEQENETPPATSSETEQPKGEPETEEKEGNKSSEETKKE